MVIRGSDEVKDPRFTVGINIVLEGSKRMSLVQQDAAMVVDPVRVVVTSADGSLVLVDEVLPARDFSTGSVGFGLQAKGLRFEAK